MSGISEFTKKYVCKRANYLHAHNLSYTDVFEALTVAFSLLLGKEISVEHPYGWLSVFDKDELQEFIKELSEAFRSIDFSTTAWEMIDTLIHEWQESSIAIASPELAAAFSPETEEVSLISNDKEMGYTNPVRDHYTSETL